MAVIVIAYTTKEVDGKTVRIYDDSTEKYFESADMQNTIDYIEYLGIKGYTVDSSLIKIFQENEFDAKKLYEQDALNKLTEKEKEILGLS
jgi:hypothetical protein